MIDKLELEKNLAGIKAEIEEIFLRLSKADSQRLSHVHRYFSDGQELFSFAESTQESVSLLNQFEALFLRLMGYVILVKERRHKDPYFQELLLRNKIIEIESGVII